MNNLSPKKSRGFSLIEALVAALIVAVGMIGLARLQGVTLLNSAESRMRTDALNLAQEKIEDLRTFANQDTYTGLNNGANASTDSIMAGTSANFTRTWTLSTCSNGVNCKQVNVSVAWVDQKGDSQTVQLTSFIGETDPVMAGVVLATGGTSSSSSSSSSTSSSTSSTSSSSSSNSTSSSTSSSSSSSGSSSTGSSSSSSSSSGGLGACSWTGGTVNNGDSATAYQSATVAFGQTCTDESRSCANGTLSGSFNYISCTVQSAADCTFNGTTVAHNDVVTAYNSASVISPATCLTESRICTDGDLSGSYAFDECSSSAVTVSCSRNGGSNNYSSSPSGHNSCCALVGCSGNNCTFTTQCN